MTVEVTEGRPTEVGGMPVRRSLPQRRRRTVGAWCFVDHFGPADVAEASMLVGPHPHLGLHTVTWVLDGEVVHHDSLGSEQLIKPGQLNLMTAGRGVAHAEETPPGATGALHGLQLWVAQPDATRSGPAAFEHHSALPEAEVGPVVATVLVGELAGVRSPARADSPLVGADLLASEWKYLPVRRTALFLEESLYRGTQWVVFEPNDEPLWAQIRLNIGAFMQNLFRQGVCQGRSPREAYIVKCDRETTTQNDINLGIVNILVGFAPLKPAEFVVIRIQQMAGQVEA